MHDRPRLTRINPEFCPSLIGVSPVPPGVPGVFRSFSVGSSPKSGIADVFLAAVDAVLRSARSENVLRFVADSSEWKLVPPRRLVEDGQLTVGSANLLDGSRR